MQTNPYTHLTSSIRRLISRRHAGGMAMILTSLALQPQAAELLQDPAMDRLMTQIRVESWQRDDFIRILETAEEARQRIRASDTADVREALGQIEADMTDQLSEVLYGDQMDRFRLLMQMNRIHGLTPAGHPLPELARTGQTRPDAAPGLSEEASDD